MTLNEQFDKGEITFHDHKEQVAYIDNCVHDLHKQKAHKQEIYEKSKECFTLDLENVSDQDSSKLRIVLSTGNKDKLGKAMRMVINKAPGGLKKFFSSRKKAESDTYYDLAEQTETLQQLETTKLLFDVMHGDIATAQEAARIIATRKMNRRSQEFIDFDPVKVAQDILVERHMQKATVDDTDMVSTPAYNRTSNISQEVDQRIADALNKIDVKTIDDLPQFLDAVGRVLNDLDQKGLLKQEDQINVLGFALEKFIADLTDLNQWRSDIFSFLKTLDSHFSVYYGLNARNPEKLQKDISNFIRLHKFQAIDFSKLSKEESVAILTRAAATYVRAFAINSGVRAIGSKTSGAVDRAVQKLRPLGLGSTGRTVPKNLHEKLVMEEAMSDPYIGNPIDISNGMTDRRWPQEEGWVKMSWYNDPFKIEVHYVAQWKNGIIEAIDDFKFKDKK